MAVTLWHNPRCSKSHAALAWLQARGIEPEQRLYLKNAPSLEELRALLSALSRPAADMLRPEGKDWRGRGADTILAAIAETPALLERPIIVAGDRAVIARPTEVLETLFPAE